MAITAYTKTCARHTPGNTTLILFSADEVAGVVLSSGNVTGITLDSGKTAVVVTADTDGIKTIIEPVTTKGGLYYVTQKIEAHFSKLSATLMGLIEDLADQSVCGIGALVTDNNGGQWLYGANVTSASTAEVKGLYMETAPYDSGLNLDEEDADKFVVTLTCMVKSLPLPVTGTIGTPTSGVIATPIVATS
jgi:hypothetical protein